MVNIEKLREQYPTGSRLLLRHMNDEPYHPVPDNSYGTVDHVDDIGTIHCTFGSRRIGIVPEVDEFEPVSGIEVHSLMIDDKKYPSYIKKDYCLSPCMNGFSQGISYWISRMGYTKGLYAFTIHALRDIKDMDLPLDVKDLDDPAIKEKAEKTMDSYIAMFQSDSDKELLKEAKELISNYCQREFDECVDFTDLTSVGVGYTTTEDERHQIQVEVDLINYAMYTMLDGEEIQKEQYKDLSQMIEECLKFLSFDELVSLPDSVQAKLDKEAEDANLAVYQKMQDEQKVYTDWLLTCAPEEIIKHSWETTVRQDIVLAMEYTTLTVAQCEALMQSPTLVADILHEYDKVDHSYMETLQQIIENRASDKVREANK